MEALLDALQWIADFFGGTGDDMANFFDQTMTYVLQRMLIWWYELKLEGVQLAWGIAKGIIEDLGVAAQLTQAWSQVPPEALSVLKFFRIPEAVSVMLNAAVTRMVINFIPGL